MTVLERIRVFLKEHHADFQVTSHRPVYTSAEAARVRGESLQSGAKVLILKVDDGFALFVLPGDRRMNSKRIKQAAGVKHLRFATSEEVETLTGLTIGSIPPFGSLFGMRTFCDPLLGQNEQINFNAGEHTVSIRMRYVDYIAVECPTLAEFAERNEQ
jgi:Ala-tRNA(Pro) deacylase